MNKNVLVLLIAAAGLFAGAFVATRQPEVPMEPSQEILDEVQSEQTETAAMREISDSPPEQPSIERHTRQDSPYQYEPVKTATSMPKEPVKQITPNTIEPYEASSTSESNSYSPQNTQAMVPDTNPFSGREKLPVTQATDKSDTEDTNSDDTSDPDTSDKTRVEANPCGDLQAQEEKVAILMQQVMQNSPSVTWEMVEKEVEYLNELRACQVIGEFDNQ